MQKEGEIIVRAETLNKLSESLAKITTRLEAIEVQLKQNTDREYWEARRMQRAVIGRQAARAGMGVREWEKHCERTGHDPMQMDRSIPNHAPNSGRTGNKNKKKKAVAPRDGL